MSELWSSERLIYRAVETEDHSLLASISTDPQGFMQATPFLAVLHGKKASVKYQEFLESCLIAAVICIAPPADAHIANRTVEDPASKPIPIGVIHLGPMDPRVAHQRRSEIGINIVRRYQGQGYGSEAIKWILVSLFRRRSSHVKCAAASLA